MKQIKDKISHLKGFPFLAYRRRAQLIALIIVATVSSIGCKNQVVSGELSAESTPEEILRVDELKLPPTHPDEPAEYTYNERFSTENALGDIFQVKDAFSSFRKLTVEAETVLEQKTLDEIGNTGWEIQNLGFPNWVGSIEGTIMKQDYLIKKLELELAQKQYQDEEIDRAALDLKVDTYELAKQDFLKFWESFKVSD